MERQLMEIPWLRRNFLARRRLDRIFLDVPDAIYRSVTGRRHWPAYSLRAFVGGIDDFEGASHWFLEDFTQLKLLGPGSRILDIGCGCGRVAYGLATSRRLKEWAVSYAGMDVDRDCIRWCARNIAPLNREFRFYHVDAFNPSYNPAGSAEASKAPFPHAAESFDLILATSVFTHLLPADLDHYFSESARVLAPGGVVYASFFLLNARDGDSPDERRHLATFGSAFGHYAVNRTDLPTNAVAYDEGYIPELAGRVGLEKRGPIRYGAQDVLLLTRTAPRPVR
jgi:SAM-dependent methyltransferase